MFPTELETRGKGVIGVVEDFEWDLWDGVCAVIEWEDLGVGLVAVVVTMLVIVYMSDTACTGFMTM